MDEKKPTDDAIPEFGRQLTENYLAGVEAFVKALNSEGPSKP